MSTKILNTLSDTSAPISSLDSQLFYNALRRIPVVVRLSRQLAQVLREALALRDEQPVLEVATFRVGGEQLEAKLDAHAVLASILQTLKQQGREALDYLALVLTASGEPPKILSPPSF